MNSDALAKPAPPDPVETAPADPGSFRDRSSQVRTHGGTVARLLDTEALEHWRGLAQSRLFARATAQGRLVPTREMEGAAWRAWPGAEAWAGCLLHERIPFISYPYEWSFRMLKDAALLHLELLLEALDEGFTLKDATPYNVQWKGTAPLFIDIPSFVPLGAGQGWVGYHQFCRMFLYPLLLEAYRGIAFQPLLRAHLEGIPPEQCRRMLSWRDLLRAGVFKDVVLHAKLQALFGGHGDARAAPDLRRELAQAGFHAALIRANLRRLRKIVGGLQAAGARSAWTRYYQQLSYTDEALGQKERFVREVAGSRRWPLVWDLGCNTGRFTRLAAPHADYVVSIDSDPEVIDHFFAELHAEGCANVLPLVGDLANPSPGLGWNLRERRPLWERGRPDLVLALALVHHMVISANVPLGMFVDWLGGLGGQLVIEWVGKADPMVQTLLRNKDDQYADYRPEAFEAALERHFTIARREPLAGGTRVLYHGIPNR